MGKRRNCNAGERYESKGPNVLLHPTHQASEEQPNIEIHAGDTRACLSFSELKIVRVEYRRFYGYSRRILVDEHIPLVVES